jgi:uncharacterized protein (UPF0548 family)
MILLRRPSEATIREFLARQRDQAFSYPQVGATRDQPPAGYAVDHTRVLLGNGSAVYSRAVAAVRRWEMFRLGWVDLLPRGASIEAGSTVAILARAGTYWLNAARIVYVIDAPGDVRRFGFAYGTLPDHVERGEERFTVEWDVAEGSVWYDLLAFSRPRHPLARAGYPVTRRLQRRFAAGSQRAMVEAVRGS